MQVCNGDIKLLSSTFRNESSSRMADLLEVTLGLMREINDCSYSILANLSNSGQIDPRL